MRMNRMIRIGRWFFGTEAGQTIAAGLYLGALVKTWGKASGLMLIGATAGGLWAGGTQAGRRARDSGDEYWDGFVGFIREEWAVSAAITGTLVLATAGIGLAAKGGVALAGASKKGGGVLGKTVVPNGVKVQKWLNKNVPVEFHAETIAAFGSDIKVTTAKKSIVAHRYWDGIEAMEFGRWLTPHKYSNPISSLALYNNLATNISSFTIPKGTKFLSGTVAQTSTQLGGGFQFRIANAIILIPL